MASMRGRRTIAIFNKVPEAMTRLFLICAGINGLLAVIIGAFGAHGLKGKISIEMMSAYNTGVQYQFYHTLALLALALYMAAVEQTRLLVMSCAFFILGTLAFSGSLYWLALGGPSWLGPITPLGGLCFMVGWVALIIYALQFHKTNPV